MNIPLVPMYFYNKTIPILYNCFSFEDGDEA